MSCCDINPSYSLEYGASLEYSNVIKSTQKVEQAAAAAEEWRAGLVLAYITASESYQPWDGTDNTLPLSVLRCCVKFDGSDPVNISTVITSGNINSNALYLAATPDQSLTVDQINIMRSWSLSVVDQRDNANLVGA